MMDDWQTSLILRLARTINPPVQSDPPITLHVDQLRRYPEGTLGREVARFLDSHAFTPFNSGDLVQRTHDIWHVLTGLSTSDYDELLLQAFTRAQVFRPSSSVLVLLGVILGKLKLRDVAYGLQRGRMARRIVDWLRHDLESSWGMPLTEVQKALNIVPLTSDQRL